MRFGIGMNTDHTLEEVGQQFSVTRERIRQASAGEGVEAAEASVAVAEDAELPRPMSKAFPLFEEEALTDVSRAASLGHWRA